MGLISVAAYLLPHGDRPPCLLRMSGDRHLIKDWFEKKRYLRGLSGSLRTSGEVTSDKEKDSRDEQ